MNLFVGNLSHETGEQQLRELFSEFGNVQSVKVLMDPQTGMPRGFGFVEMETKSAGYEAILNLDTTYFLGNIISVKEARNNKSGNNSNERSRPGSRNFQKRPGYANSRSGYQSSGRQSESRFYPGKQGDSYQNRNQASDNNQLDY